MQTLALFVKQPTPGRVKTRLAADLGPEAAATVYAAFTDDLVERFAATGERRVLCFAPSTESARAHFHGVGDGRYDLWPQPDEGLGERLAACVRDHRPSSRPDDAESPTDTAAANALVIIGSDSPSLPVDLVQRAFESLKRHDCVLGPATDGGYYLVGLRGDPRGIFDGIDWSSERVLGQTVERVERAGLSLALLPPWYDVDTLDDLRMLDGHLRALRTAGEAVGTAVTRVLADLEPALR